MSKLPFLKVYKSKIVDESGRSVTLKGVSLGGWLMMEGYMLCGRNIAERTFRENFEKALGRDTLADFTRSFRDAFITEEDIEIIKGWGANCIRVPFNYKVVEFEDRPFSLNEEGLSYLDKVVKWCQRHELYCILDMHAAPGAQNPDWHSDCSDKPDLFSNEFNKDRYLRLWHFLASRYKDYSAVAGYDILNEPVVDTGQEALVKDLYERATKEIRDAGDRHIIFLEGNQWAQRLNFLGTPVDSNTAYSIHAYPPIAFTFNLERELHYPGKAYGITWNKTALEMLGMTYRNFIKRHDVPLYVGEFGVNARDGYYGENAWVSDMLSIFKKHSLHWTYWTYKTVANCVYPDGIYRYVENPAWVNRQGPVSGWETFSALWPKEKGRMTFSWRTENFKSNDKLLAVLKRNFVNKK
jgi:hypothetical protein